MTKREPLEVLYRNVRDRLKCGDLSNFRKEDARNMDDLIKEGVDKCPFAEGSLQFHFFKLQSELHARGYEPRDSVVNNPLYLKAVSISLDFRDYLEALSPEDGGRGEHRALLERLALKFLAQFGNRALGHSTPQERELIKEKARLVSTYANQLWREQRYEDAEQAIRSAKHTIIKVLRPKGMNCNTVLGALFYVESKLLRHRGQYRECEKLLTKAIDHYSAWVTHNSADPKNIQLASYKIAMFLGGIAWCKNSRGFCRDAQALINAARLLILPTGWELDKAHLDIIYADVVRALTGTKRLKNAILIVERSHATFKKHSHERMTARSAFTSALLNYYGDNLRAAETRLDEVEQFSGSAKDTRWLVNCRNLRARIRLKQRRAGEALALSCKSIDEVRGGRLTNQLVVANIIKGEAHALLGNYREAVEALDRARKENEKRVRVGFEVSIERNEAWILLSLAQTYLLSKDVRQAGVWLERAWERLEGVELKWLHEKAKQLTDEVRAYTTQDFLIASDTNSLDWDKHTNALFSWMENQVRLRSGSKEREEVASALGRTARWVSLQRAAATKKSSTLRKKVSPPRRKSRR